MSYHERFLKAKGQDCIILRPIPVNTKASIKRTTRASRDLGAREGYWEGTILAEVALQSGEVIEIFGNKYLVQSSNLDPESGETAFFAAKCNATIQHKREDDGTDLDGNLIKIWKPVNPDAPDVPAYIEVVTYSLRQYDPGLLEQTRYLAQVSKSIGAMLLDRFVMDDGNMQVVSINNVGLEGTAILQLGIDIRP